MTETSAPPTPVLGFADGSLLRDGRPHRLLSGSVHYFRVHPAQWRDRLERLRALGLNTVDTYVPWNFHERRPGERRWSGRHDFERFVGIAGELGLDVIVRPGPYICAEWDNGGFPAWLTGTPGISLRSSDAAYLDAVGAWFDELLPRIARLQAAAGGPIVAVQLENEYGSYGDDADYLGWLHARLLAAGIVELIYTADGPTELMQDGGSVPGVLAAATFGSRASQAAALLRERRTGEPFLCAEFWNGWFDHWGEPHHVRSAGGAADVVAEILAEGGSLSLYMAHGGSNFGLYAGANHDGVRLQPTQTSYDSDAPIAEDGAITEKFRRIREVIAGATGIRPPEASAPAPLLPATSLPMRPGAGLLEALRGAGSPVRSPVPPSFEELGIDAGLVLYEAHPVVPRGGATLTIRGLRDRALVFVDGRRIAVLDAEGALEGIPLEGRGELEGRGGSVRLEIVVENQGRINFGPLLGEGKGILGGVLLDRRLVQRWSARPLPLEEWDAATLARLTGGAGSVEASGAGFATASLTVLEPGDAFLAFPGFGKGFVWVNGFLLGRYWEVGPQVTYYLPGPLLHAGENTITVLELERFGDSIEVRERAELGPEEEYVETFD